MKNQPKRLSDVTKQQTTDRASKLASSFLPDDDDVTPVSKPAAEPLRAESIQEKPVSVAQESGSDDLPSPVPVPSVSRPLPPAASERPKERTRRPGPTVDLTDLIGQPLPEGLRCTRMIAMADEHHDLLRELQFMYKKPMTAILYNLLEPARQALQREKMKGN